jgi:hypothetical protein
VRRTGLARQALDQLRAGSLILDQHDTRAECLALLAHGAHQLGIFHALAQDVWYFGPVWVRIPRFGRDSAFSDYDQ